MALIFFPLAYFFTLSAIQSRRDIGLILAVILAALAIAGIKVLVISIMVWHRFQETSYAWQALLESSDLLAGQRTRLIGADTMFLLIVPFVCSLALMVNRRRTYWLILIAWVPVVVGLLLSLTRTYWATAILSMVLVLLLGIRRNSMKDVFRVVVPAMLIPLMIVLLYWTFEPGPSSFNYGETFTTRLDIDNPSTVNGALKFRVREVEGLMEVAGSHLVLGNGLGADFSYLGSQKKTVTTRNAHIGPLWVLLKSGIIGVVIFHLALLLSIAKALCISRETSDRFMKAVSLGTGLALFALFIISVVQNRIPTFEGAYFLGLAMALPQVLCKLIGDSGPAISDILRDKACVTCKS